MDDFIKSVETTEEAIEVFNQLQPLLSQHGFELKKWISNDDAVTEAIPEDLKSVSNTKQVEVEPSTEGSSVLGLQWTVTDDSHQMCRGTNKKVETPETQRKVEDSVTGIFSIRPHRIVCSVQCSHETTSERYLDQEWTTLGQQGGA